MANLMEMAKLSRLEVTELNRYFNAVRKAHGGSSDAAWELMGFLPNPKVPRPIFSENQEKTLLVQTGMWAQRRMEEGENGNNRA